MCRMLLWQWLVCCFFILLLPGLSHAVEVTLYTGNATHRIPIELPPGPGGFGPSLALVYNGSEANGWLGIGWQLEGISYIEATPSEAQSTTTGLGITYRLVLGAINQKLIFAGEDPSGTITGNYWRTEQESFLRIQKVDGAEPRWIVTDRNGVQYLFGSPHSDTSPSIVGKQGGAWGRMYLTQIEDPHGNQITYTYSYLPSSATRTSDAYVQGISWNGGRVSFNWGTGQLRPDPFILKVATPNLQPSTTNTLVTIDRRLFGIEVNFGTSLIRRYALGYDPNPAQTPLRHRVVSQLTTVRLLGADNSLALPVTRFSYNSPATGAAMTEASPALSGDPVETLDRCGRAVDWNGDGLTDMVFGDTSRYVGYKVYRRDPANPTTFLSPLNVAVLTPGPNGIIPSLCGNDAEVRTVQTAAGRVPLPRTGTVPVHNAEFVDIDGDGLPDILRRPGSHFGPQAGEWMWWRNEGTQFASGKALIGPPPLDWLDDPQIQMADMNGDSLVDFVWFPFENFSNTDGLFNFPINWWANVGNGEFRNPISFEANNNNNICGLPRVSGCQDLAVLTVPQSTGWKNQLADMNGDGLLDLVNVIKESGGTTGIPRWRYLPAALDSVSGCLFFRPLVTMNNPTAPTPEYPITRNLFVLDVNGDWLPDILRGGASGEVPIYYPNIDGKTLGAGIELTGAPAISTSAAPHVVLSDVDGNGFIDILSGSANDYRYWTFSGQTDNHRLLETMRTPYGGTETVNYVRERGGRAKLWAVSQTIRDNGLGQVSTTDYAYTGGQSAGWPWNEFRGFAQATITDPPDHLNQRHKTVTRFHQDDALKGRIDLIEVQNNSGSAFTTTDYTYTSSSPVGGVTRVDLTSQKATTLDGSGPGKFVQTDFGSYDNYGQAGQVTSSGTYTATRVTTTDFTYNPTDYIVSKPSHSRTTVNGIRISESWFNYDGQDNGVGPTKGDLTLEKRWLSFGGTHPEVQHFYDNVGRRTGTIDPKLNICDTTLRTTQFEYNTTTFFTLPIKEINARCQETGKTYWGVDSFTVISGAYAVPGLLATVTDPNGVTTTNYFDALGRPMATIVPPDDSSFLTTRWTYTFTLDALNNGVAPSKTQVQKREKAGNAGTLDSVTYVDGFGRIIQTKTEAETPGQWITQDTVYNARGLVESVSIPYLTSTSNRTPADSAQPKTTTFYDAVRRPTKITNPDTTFKTIAYDRWVVTETDEKSFATVRTFDALGRLLKVQEPSDGGLTLYSYDHFDANGNEGRRITDAQQNKTTERYDSLGRKIALSDPDLGSCGDLTTLSPNPSFPWYPAPCWSYFYDANGNLLKQMDGQGTVLDFTYDELNRIETKSFTDLGQPSAPSGLTATAISASRIDLSWSAASDNIGVKEYRVERCNNRPGTPACSNFSQITSVITTSFSNTGLIDGMDYTYRIRAMDTSGNLGSFSILATATTPDITPPTAPTGLTATAFASNRIDLSWTASTDNVGVTAYQVQRCQGTGCTPTLIATVTGTSYNDTQRTASTTYTYRVRATDAAGNFSNFSSSVNRATPAAPADSTLPTVPATLTATAVSSTQVNLTWTASTDDLLLSYYEVERSTNNGPYTVLSAPVATNFTDNTVTAGITYLYRVRAVDGANNKSNYSTKDFATTIFFTDDPLAAGVTVVKAIHITQLRQAVNAVRASAGLDAATWTDATLNGVLVKATHIQELRNNLNQALTTLGLPLPNYTDPTLTSLVTAVKAVHVGDPRQGVK